MLRTGSLGKEPEALDLEPRHGARGLGLCSWGMGLWARGMSIGFGLMALGLGHEYWLCARPTLCARLVMRLWTCLSHVYEVFEH